MSRPSDSRHGLTVTTHERDGATVITAQGPVDLATCPTLVDEINAALATQPSALLIDFTGVTILGSAGLEILVRTRRAADADMYLAVIADGPATSRVIEITGLNLVMVMHKSLDAAISAWHARRRPIDAGSR